MRPDLYVDRVLEDEGLVGDLDEAEASLLVTSVVDRVRKVCDKTNDAGIAAGEVEKLCKQARRLASIVVAYRDKDDAEAKKMTSAEGWSWPAEVATPAELLRSLLNQLH